MKEMRIFNVEISGVESSMIASGYPMESKEVKMYDTTPGGSKSLFYDHSARSVNYYDGGELTVIKVMSPTISKLAKAKPGSGHDCFLKGIHVSFDISYPVYWSPQLQRYHHLDIVSSTSAMHRLTKLELSEFMTKTVEPEIISVVSDMIHVYNKALNLINEIKEVDSSIKDVFIRKYYTKNDETFWDLHILTRDNSLVNKDRYDNYEKIEDSTRWDTYTIEDMFQKIVATCPQGLMKVMRVTTNALQLKTIISQRSGHKLDEWKYFVNWAKSLYFWRFFDMYQENVTPEENKIMNKFDTLLQLLLRGYDYYRIDSERSDFSNDITPYYYELNGERRPLNEDDNYARSISSEIDRMFSSDDYTLNIRSYMCQVWNNHQLILIHRDLKTCRNKARKQQQIIKTLEFYILQHAHGKMTAEEMCSKTKEILGGCDD